MNPPPPQKKKTYQISTWNLTDLQIVLNTYTNPY